MRAVDAFVGGRDADAWDATQRPVLMSCGTTRLTMSTGKSRGPMPAGRSRLGQGFRGVDADQPAGAIEQGGPPELPGFTAASVWIHAAPLRGPSAVGQAPFQRADDCQWSGVREQARKGCRWP